MNFECFAKTNTQPEITLTRDGHAPLTLLTAGQDANAGPVGPTTSRMSISITTKSETVKVVTSGSLPVIQLNQYDRRVEAVAICADLKIFVEDGTDGDYNDAYVRLTAWIPYFTSGQPGTTQSAEAS